MIWQAAREANRGSGFHIRVWQKMRLPKLLTILYVLRRVKDAFQWLHAPLQKAPEFLRLSERTDEAHIAEIYDDVRARPRQNLRSIP